MDRSIDQWIDRYIDRSFDGWMDAALTYFLCVLFQTRNLLTFLSDVSLQHVLYPVLCPHAESCFHGAQHFSDTILWQVPMGLKLDSEIKVFKIMLRL